MNSPADQRSAYRKRLWWVFVLNALFLILELAGGLLTGSLALLSDAGHMFTDVAAIGLALFAGYLAMKPDDPSRTYGYLRAEILAALLNGAGLLVMCGYILHEAYGRLQSPTDVAGAPILIIGSVGLIVNLVSAWYARQGRNENLNVEGAYLHMVADALGSAGAMTAGIVIMLTGWMPIDALVSILIAALILWSGWRLMMKSIDILMEGTPAEINYQQVKAALESGEHIRDIHDLHVWTISSGVLALSAHIRMSDDCVSTGHWPICLRVTQNMLREKWGIEHTTLQTEPQSYRQTAQEDQSEQ